MKLKHLAQTLFVAGCFVSAAAMAKTEKLTVKSTVVASQQTNLTATLDFTQFNPNKGTLTGVSFELFADVAGSVRLRNDNEDPIDVPVRLSVDIWMDRPDQTPLIRFTQPLLNQTVTLDGSGGTDFLNKSLNVTKSASFDGLSDLALFTGTGSVSTLFAAKAFSQAEGDGVAAKFLTTVGGYGLVTYTYNAAPVPEPETYGMLLAGLALIGVAARRKARKN